MPATGESPDYVQNILESLRSKKRTYLSGEHVTDSLGATSLTILAGPIGVQKNETRREVIRISDEEDYTIAEVNPTYTRARHLDDPIGARTANDGVTFEELNDAVINGSLVNFDVIGDDIEATYRSGFPGRYNIGTAPTDSILHMMNAGFYDCNVAFMVTDGETHERQLRTERATYPDFIPRVIDGLELLEFARMNIQSNWLHAVEIPSGLDGPTKAARKVINIVRHQTSEIISDDQALHYIGEMWDALQRVVHDVH